jgi:hypothetical protein
MQTAFIGVADVHAGPLADGFQPLQLVNFRGVVFYIWIRVSAHLADKFSLNLGRGNRLTGANFRGLKATGERYEKRPLETNIICGFLSEKTQLVVDFGGPLR